MKLLVLIACFALAAPAARSLPTPPEDSEDSVVSIYTTPAGSNKTNPLDVYQQIAHNVATRLTNPIYRFFGYGTNKTEEAPDPKKQWNKLEILYDSTEDVKPDLKSVSTNILGLGRDVEELSEEAKKKADQKPEKITLYSNVLNWADSFGAAQNSEVTRNDTINEVSDKDDDELTLDDIDVDDKKPRSVQSTFVYILELIGSWIQLIYGGLAGIFGSKSSSS